MTRNRVDEGATATPLEHLLQNVEHTLLPLRAARVTMRTSRDCACRFVHAHALSAWLRRLSDSEGDDASSWYTRLRVDTLESGRVSYRAGDRYTFTLVCTATGVGTLRQLIERMAYPDAATTPSHASAAAFGPHWALESVADFFTDEEVSSIDSLSTYDWTALQREAALWSGERARPTLIWQWLTPARLLRDKESRGQGERRFCRDSGDISLALLGERAFDTLAGLLRAFETEAPRREGAELDGELVGGTVFWVEDDYHGGDGSAKPKGGLLGRHRLDVTLSPAWAAVLVLGQYLGLGQGAATGLGRYRLETPDGHHSYRRGVPSRSWIELALASDNLHAAWRHVNARRGDAARTDEEATEEAHDHDPLADEQDEHLTDDPEGTHVREVLSGRIRSIRAGQYTPPPARAGFLPKPDGGMRPLAVPPFWDAVLQRAFTQVLTPALDSLMHPQSFGYRRGRSRRSAAEAIGRARREGYRWLYDADIEDFFGAVDHTNLHERLLSLFDDDPVIDLVMRWVRTPLLWRGEQYPRVRGLPQGSSLSPLLANLMLDDFDNDMQAAGIRLVRFADDFVLLARSRRRAEEAAASARRSLAEHGLFLHEGKSEVRDLDDGVDFLGYLMVGDMAIDLAGRAPSGEAKTALERVDDKALEVVASRWLARLSGTIPRSLNERQLLAEEARGTLARRGDDGAAEGVGEQYDPDGSVFVAGAPCALFTEAGSLVVVRDEERLLVRPWRHLLHVFVMGRHHVSLPALRAAAAHAVTVHLMSASGRYQAAVARPPSAGEQRTWLEQLIASEDESLSLPIAKALVAARIRHQRDVLRSRRDADAPYRATALLRQVESADSANELRGAEGLAASAYFEAFGTLVPEPFTFDGRRRRPPPDPVNAMLSLGYTMLYGLADGLLRAEGLLPAVGLYHRQRGEHAALASDMMEPFRHVVERQALMLLRRRVLTSEDFERTENGGCLLVATARRRFATALVERFARPVRAVGESEALPVRSHLQRQSHSLRRAIQTRDPDEFKVYRVR